MFTYAGVLQSQYDHMSQFAGLLVATTFDVVSLLPIVDTCCYKCYCCLQCTRNLALVVQAMEHSMAAAVDELKAFPANKGEVLCDTESICLIVQFY